MCWVTGLGCAGSGQVWDILVPPSFLLVLQDKVRQRVHLTPLGAPGIPHLAQGSHGKPWSPPDPGHVPPIPRCPLPQPCPGALTTSPAGSSWILAGSCKGKAKPFPFPFFSCCILMGLEISRRKALFPFYQLGAHSRLPGSLPPLLCFPPSSPWLPLADKDV